MKVIVFLSFKAFCCLLYQEGLLWQMPVKSTMSSSNFQPIHCSILSAFITYCSFIAPPVKLCQNFYGHEIEQIQESFEIKAVSFLFSFDANKVVLLSLELFEQSEEVLKKVFVLTVFAVIIINSKHVLRSLHIKAQFLKFLLFIYLFLPHCSTQNSLIIF